ncbi:DUF1850 domain-containing protein [Ferviditalea candida]|uniref:DUF1850 domain-containing protein n=1 Tax=Ferviditalea candida TaxID=3108399 RepID=A0ABU5ZIN2_9BACL|nr:DUF1850 domain-containing protein [Paenibacillaceae bacterium T2]
MKTLEVSTNGQLQYALLVHEGSDFSIRWTHSVEKEDWEEFFRIEQGTIYLESTRFKTFGAGVPSDVGTGSFLKDGWVYMVGIHRFIGELDLLAGDDTNHRLMVNGQKLVLSRPPQETPYHFAVKKHPLVLALYKVFIESR